MSSRFSRRRNKTTATASFVATFTAMVVIPLSIIYGRMGDSWVPLANVMFCLGLAVIAGGVILGIWMRFRRSERSSAVCNQEHP